jgi:hypothetical protein
MGMIPGMGGMAKQAQDAVDRGRAEADRGHHPIDDVTRAPQPVGARCLAAPAHRDRLGEPA